MRILLTGGSACGKSAFAEALAVQLGSPRFYLATMRPFGKESLRKIAAHRDMRREKGFETIEREVGVDKAEFPPDATLLLECLCNLTANELFDGEGCVDGDAYQRIYEGIVALEGRCANLIVVTNDVGSGTTAGYDDATRLYVELLGRLNAELASRFDVVCEQVCGIPVALKDQSRQDRVPFEYLLAAIDPPYRLPSAPRRDAGLSDTGPSPAYPSDRIIHGDRLGLSPESGDGTMVLVVGGAASGKLSYVRSLGYNDEHLADAVLDGKPVIYNLQDLVAASGKAAPTLLEPLLAKEVVVCDEVGSGIVPVKPSEREAREATGRLCNQLAQRADVVIRLVAGIPTRLKG